MKEQQQSIHDDPGEELLKEAFQKTLLHNQKNKNDKNDNIKLTKEEMNHLEKAFEEKEFRNLMVEYMNEISDPKYRAEQDEYLRQLEEQNELPNGKDILRPEPGFVMKFKFTREKKQKKQKSSKHKKVQEKLFVNIVHSKQIDQPTYTTATSTTRSNHDQNGRNWSIPYTMGPMRMEVDNKKNLVPTFDCCFHPLALLYASKNIAYRDLIASTAREGVSKQYQSTRSNNECVDIDKTYHILKGAKYKNGKPPAMMIEKKTNLSSVSIQGQSNHESSSQMITPNNEKMVKTENSNIMLPKDNDGHETKNTSLAKGFLLREQSSKTRNNNNQKIVFDKGGGKTTEGNVIPNYEIIERGEFDLADTTNIEGLKTPSSRPNSLIIRIRLPGIKSSKNLDLDVSEKRLELNCPHSEDKKYTLNIPLPYPVLSDDGKAKFDKDLHVLSVTLPVIRPDEEKPLSQTESYENKCTTPKKTTRHDDGKLNIEHTIDNHDDGAKNSLDESPVLVEKPPDHSRWLVNDMDDTRTTRETFASDDVIPTLAREEVVVQSDTDSTDNITNIEERTDPNTNKIATNDDDDVDVDDDFQMIELNDRETDENDAGSNDGGTDITVSSSSSSPQQSFLYCHCNSAFELD